MVELRFIRRIIFTLALFINIISFSSCQPTSNPKRLFEMANEKASKKLYREAKIDLDKAIAIDSNYADAYLMRSLLKKFLNIEYCSDVKKANDLGNEKAKEVYQQFCMVISEKEIATRIFPDDSLSKLYPYRPEPLYNISNVYFEAKQYRKAIEYCDKALAVYPKYAPAIYNKGACLISMGDYNNGCKLIYKAADMGDEMALQAKPQCKTYYSGK